MKPHELPAELAAVRLPDQTSIYRVCLHPDWFDGAFGLRRPTAAAFIFSPADVAEAVEKRWTAPALSVWDARKATPAQAIARLSTEHERAAVVVGVAVAHGILLADDQACFAVARTPLTDTLADGAAHASFFGLPHRAGPLATPKSEFELRRQARKQLIAQFQRVDNDGNIL